MALSKKVIKQHFPPVRKDIELSVGDEVEIGKEDTGNPNWKNWVWCTAVVNDTSGWVPKQYLQIKNLTAIAIKEYSSVELAVFEGDMLQVHFHLNGWAWCSNSSNEQGWVPDEHLE